ncbi:hypothetical protein NDI76_08610 [Halogeometricum sp. S1BR25-6]|uniref:DUF7964 domain-containing protein n=1 Tax=Halogeometricum salsisoli TaxID=2950536 RepID=A0ABU2GDC7_9EURY|nr:hypothetical protein [Halogeometricum sp. S1BR25-6]MDS0298803.1 hypothetical protein [Halogeometricum sp. S1BR25-6]
MGLVESLPPRPLSAKELLDLNRSEVFELASPIEEEGDASAVILATESWVKGLVFDGESGGDGEGDGDGWTVVETVSLAERERIDGLRACEDAILAFRGDSPDVVDGEGRGDDSGDADGDVDSAAK